MNRRLLIVLALFLSAGALRAVPAAVAQGREDSTSEITSAVKDLETALFSGTLTPVKGHIGKQVFLSLKGGESGYFSANQAHFVLQEYFNARKVVSLHFGPVAERDGSTYATGTGTMRHRGVLQPLQIFVSFAQLDGRWVIAQLNVY